MLWTRSKRRTPKKCVGYWWLAGQSLSSKAFEFSCTVFSRIFGEVFLFLCGYHGYKCSNSKGEKVQITCSHTLSRARLCNGVCVWVARYNTSHCVGSATERKPKCWIAVVILWTTCRTRRMPMWCRLFCFRSWTLNKQHHWQKDNVLDIGDQGRAMTLKLGNNYWVRWEYMTCLSAVFYLWCH